MGPPGLVVVAGIAGWLFAMPAQAETFVLAGGETIEGAIVDASRNTLVIRRAEGGMRQIPIHRLQRIRVTTAEGQTLTGSFHGWQDGRTAIEVGSDVVWVEQDQVVERAPLTRRALATDRAAEPAAAASSPQPATPEVAATRATPEQAGPKPAAGPKPTAQPGPDLPVLSVKTAPDDVTEKAGEVVFTVELSRPIDDLLVLIYSTVDGTAHAGADYAALQGILTLPAGTTRSEIRTAILDDGKPAGDKDFNLFLAANPDLTRIAQQWTRVTIHDSD